MIEDLAHCKRSSENSARTTYEIARDEALDYLLLDFVVKNSSFVAGLNDIYDTNPIQDLAYIYNVLSTFELNTYDTWDLMKSKFKPFVVCAVCKYQVKWTVDEKDEYAQQINMFEPTNVISDNDRYTEFLLGLNQAVR